MQEAFNDVEGYFEGSELRKKHEEAEGKSLSMVCLIMVSIRIQRDKIISYFFPLVQEQEETW